MLSRTTWTAAEQQPATSVLHKKIIQVSQERGVFNFQTTIGFILNNTVFALPTHSFSAVNNSVKEELAPTCIAQCGDACMRGDSQLLAVVVLLQLHDSTDASQAAFQLLTLDAILAHTIMHTLLLLKQ
jgi:hypothetical protein